MPDTERKRDRMVEWQVAHRGIRDAEILMALRTVPREAFLPAALREFAYEGAELPLEDGETLPHPYVAARMLQEAGIRPGDRVLQAGIGSGYLAAVASQIAGEVLAVEPEEAAAQRAMARLAAAGCTRVRLRDGDALHGLPSAGPFDAILIPRAGAAIPQPLLEQLDLSGRLVMPVEGPMRELRLVRVMRAGANRFEEEDLGEAGFVPPPGLPSGAGEPPPGPVGARPAADSLPELIRAAAEPLPALDEPAFGALFDRFAGARVVLLGEASHGTAEFYRARAAITRRLIESHGFNIVAVEAAWPDAASLDRHVRHRPASPGAEPPFRRFPTWMWRNTEMAAFVEWLRGWNAGRPPERQASFHGLDLYNLSASIEAVLGYLDRVDPEAAAVARQRYGCLSPWAVEPQRYGRLALSSGYATCEEAVARTLRELLEHKLDYARGDGESFLDAAANARLVKNAEAYYRAMYYSGAESWNLRDTHMFETLCALLEAKGPQAKAVVWAHNSHIGDASKTEMGRERDELNIGQLCRQHFGEAAALIGFGTHTGTVACADDWDEPMVVKRVNPSRPDSYERLAHDSGAGRFLLDLREGQHQRLRERLLPERLERFIGVIYRPDTERWSHYSACSLPQQFDAYVWFDETTAVTPLPTVRKAGAEETYPFGL
ncbi:erythromycin esterase family protein [Roseomonas sp. E05]|uniref:erythromycin esterase family protein n=1 Tax=Roseomonas sp. E05 TaxID=3046310 RepID=UPI0024B9711F|nr:erythromycin esterase family protein [Roseomonas sp. E05]MDJ0386960.1 erythromycin esterase family protein [Roseomonas sp. E05]